MTKILAFLISSSAFAATGAPGSYRDCGDQESTNGRYQCYMNQYQQADAELNSIYQNLQSNCYRQDKAGQVKLRDAERAWIKYRDANSKFAGHAFSGGSQEKVLVASSLADMTATRADELASHQLACQQRERIVR